MRSLLVLASIIMIGAGLIGNAYAHKSQLVDNYKFEVGWDKEPPMVGKPNNIVVTVSKAESSDKTASKQGNIKNQKHEGSDSKATHGIKKLTKSSQKIERETSTAGVSGLGSALQVDVSLNGKKTFLKMVENKNTPGTYIGAYTPETDGYPIIHLYVNLDNKDIEITFHPEKVEAK